VNNQKAKKTTKKRSGWSKRLAIALGVIFMAPVLLFVLGWFSRDLIIDELQIWYEANSNGTLEIGSVNASFIQGFPNVGFTIEDVRQTSMDTILDKKTTIQLERAQVTIGASDLLQGNIQFRNIKIQDATVHTRVTTKKSLEQYIALKLEKQREQASGFELPSWVHPEKSSFQISNVQYIDENRLLSKYFNVKAISASGNLESTNDLIVGNLNYQVLVNNLGFNTKKGSYINGATVVGNPDFELVKKTNTLKIPAFNLKLDEQQFKARAQFIFNKITDYDLSLENKDTRFANIQKFLPDSLAAKLQPYQLTHPLETKLFLKGKFSYGDVPFIHVDFVTNNNELQLFEDLQLTNVQAKGKLTNNLKKIDSLHERPGKRDIQLYFENFTANLDEIAIQANNSYYQSTANMRNQVKASVQVKGSNETMSNALRPENFTFKGGEFSLKAEIDGNIDDPFMILNAAQGTFVMANTRVALTKNNVQLPLERLDLKLDHNTSILRQLKIALPNGEILNFQGEVENVSALLATSPATPAKARLTLKSNALNLDDLLQTATKFTSQQTQRKDRLKTLHQTLDAVYKKFNPGFQLDIASVIYRDHLFQNLKAQVHLKNSEIIQFDKLVFDYQDAETELKGSVRVPEAQNTSKEPIYIDVMANSRGSIRVFQDLFNIELVSLRNGDFDFEGTFNGNVQYFDELLKNAEGNLKLTDTEFFYPEADLKFALDSLHIGVKKSNIHINRFALETRGHHPIYLQSSIRNFPSFLLEEDNKAGSIALKLDANFVDVDQWLESIASMERDSLKNRHTNTHVSKIFEDLYKFRPNITVDVDSVKFNAFISEDLKAVVGFENDSILRLSNLDFRFKETQARILGSVTAREPLKNKAIENPFDFQFSLDMEGKSKDLNELLKTVNFDLASGNFEFSGSYRGQARDLSILNSNAQGDLKLGATLVKIKETKLQVPVDSLHLIINNDLATLKRLDVDLPGKSSIDITGTIDHFSNFINNEQLELAHTSNFEIRSPYLRTQDILEFIGEDTTKKKKVHQEPFNMVKVKDILRNIHESYYPTASITVDSLALQDLNIANFNARVSFNDESDLRLTNTHFNYNQGEVEVDLLATIDVSNELPVKLKTKISQLDLHELLRDLDYLDIDALRSAEKISGMLDLEIDARARLLEDGSIDLNSLNGTIIFNLKELELFHFKPVLETVFLLKEERFEQLRFRPLTQKFTIQDGVVTIPRTQIQSSGLQLYVEGAMKLDEYLNIWLSLPWKNLKSRDGLTLPEKESYQDAGAKFYVQLKKNNKKLDRKDRQLKTRFRLWNSDLKNKHQ